MNIFVVGRMPDTTRPYIRIEDRSVSAHHGRLFELDDGGFEFIDDNSTNGSFVSSRGVWVRMGILALTADDDIRLGAFETTPATLVGLACFPEPAPKRLMRDPRTGAIVPATSTKQGR